jgi:hypothetical protein
VKYYQFCFFRDVAEESIRNEAMELRTNKPKYIYIFGDVQVLEF